jgi:hypothetical protein
MAMSPDDRWDDEVREAYQRPIPDEDRARERVIARLREEPPPRRTPWLGWWMEPDVIRARPLLAAASLIAALGIGAWGGAWWMSSRAAAVDTTAGRAAAPHLGAADMPPTAVTFVFRAPGASRVSLVGDFNGWDPQATPLRRATLGDNWIAQVPLERGLHAYAFVIDGSDWAADPSAPLAETSYGRRNSLVVVGEGGAL